MQGVLRGLGIVVIGLMLPAVAFANKPVVAVFEIQNKAKLSKDAVEQLTDFVSAQLTASGKYKVVPNSELKNALSAKKSESYQACYDEACQIEIGKEIAAEKTLATKISKLGRNCIVTMQLYDLREGAAGKGAIQRGKCDIDSILVLIESATQKLTGVRPSGSNQVQQGGRSSTPQADKSFGEQSEAWDPNAGGEEVIVDFSSTPSGAVVMVDGQLVCRATPCSKSLSAGSHEVSMQKEAYLSKKARLSLKSGSRVNWQLLANFGTLKVKSQPAGLSVMLNGKSIGTTPLSGHELSPGRYRVSIEDKCYLKKGQEVSITAGQTKNLDLQMAPREGAIKVSAEDKKGNALRADVYVDGSKVGQSPGTFKVNVCAKEVQVKHNKHGVWKKSLSVKERKLTKLKAAFRGLGGGKLTWLYSKPAKLYFTKSEVTVAQYQACVKAGKCARDTFYTKSKYDTCNWGQATRKNHPMNCVNWYGAKAYCAFVGARLPTQDEWYAEASNGGTRKYPWGSQKASCARSVMKEGSKGCGKEGTWPVCSKPEGNSVSGMCDLSGNVWEWMTTGSQGRDRVFRGASWDNGSSWHILASARYRSLPSLKVNNVGFRCVSVSAP